MPPIQYRDDVMVAWVDHGWSLIPLPPTLPRMASGPGRWPVLFTLGNDVWLGGAGIVHAPRSALVTPDPIAPPPDGKLAAPSKTAMLAASGCPLDVRARGDTTCARFADTSVWCWGVSLFDGGHHPTITAPTQLVPTGAIALAMRDYYGDAQASVRTVDGGIWRLDAAVTSSYPNACVRTGGQLPLPPIDHAASDVGCGVDETGDVRCGDEGGYCTGHDGGVTPATAWDTLIAGNPLDYSGGCALRRDGTLSCLDGAQELGPLVGGAVSVRATTCCSTTGWSACAIARDGRVGCWGDNTVGQVGDGTTIDRPRPVEVQLPTAAVALDVAARRACAALIDGTVWCWGVIDGPTPVRVFAASGALTGATGVAVGDHHACALRPDGIWCWGDNSHGQLATIRPSSSVAVQSIACAP